MILPRRPPELALEHIHQRLGHLKSLSYSELSQLPSRSEEEISLGGRAVVVATWRDNLPEGRIQVVIQVYSHVAFGIGRMCADGFIVDAAGRFSPLPQSTKWDFS